MQKPLAALAPMAGVTDWPFRLLCLEQGCDSVTTEMVSAMGLLTAPEESRAYEQLIRACPQELGRLNVQIFGREPARMAEAAARLSALGLFNAVDINMGCPAHKVAGGGAGAGLLKTPALAGRVMAAVRAATPLPVTVKIRLGWDDASRNYLEIAHIAQESGMCAITVHGRTRAQQYGGKADWRAIGEVKAAVRIPVYGNGDIFCAKDALDMLAQTGCDGVCLGRGALGNPWIFSQIAARLDGREAARPDAGEIVAMALRHARMMVDWKGEKRAVLEMRKHLSWYVQGRRGVAKLRTRINAAPDMETVCALLQAWAAQAQE